MGPQEQEEKGKLALGFLRRGERGGRRRSKAEGRANLRLFLLPFSLLFWPRFALL